MPEYSSKESSENYGANAQEDVVKTGSGIEVKAVKVDGLLSGSQELSDGATKLDEKQLKRQSNMDRCRKYRERRKKQEESVYAENAALKRERVEFQQQITQLEMEVQQLRSEGRIDVEKENELLRSEISVSITFTVIDERSC